MEVDIKELELADYDILENIKVALKRLWRFKNIVCLSTIIGILAFFAYYFIVGNTTTYYSSATIFSAVYGSAEESYSGVSVMNTYAQLLGSYRVCDKASESLQAYGITSEELQALVKSGRIYVSGASTDSKTYGYTVTLIVNYSSSEHVCDITNAMADAFTDELNDLLGQSSLQVLDRSSTFGASNSINVKMYLVLFAAAGFVMSCGIIFLLEFFSRTVYSIRQCEMDESMILGKVPYTNMQNNSL